MIDGSVVLTFMGGLAGSLALVLVARVKLTGDRDTARGPEWASFVEQQRKDIADLKADRKADREELRTLRKEVRDLEHRFSALEERYRAALAFVKWLLSKHPEHTDRIPTEISGDL